MPSHSPTSPLDLFQLVHLVKFLSSSTVLCHVVLGLPLDLVPFGCHANAVIQPLPSYIVSIWPTQFHPSWSHNLMLFVLFLCLLPFELYHCWSVVAISLLKSSLCICSERGFFVIVHVSYKYKSTDLTSVLKRWHYFFTKMITYDIHVIRNILDAMGW